MQNKPIIILGIDPGSIVMGFSVITINGAVIKILEMNALKLPAKKDNHERLHLIYNKVSQLIALFEPQHFAIEAPFFGKNVQSMLKLGRAQGVAIAAALQAGIPVTEYSPRKVKQSVTGNGNADKDQVWKMLQSITNATETPSTSDASDALAVAICHYFQLTDPRTAKKTTVTLRQKKGKGWAAFLQDNPDRVA